MTTNTDWALARLTLLANGYQNTKMSSADYCLLLAHVQSQNAQLSALSLDNSGKDVVIAEYQRQSRRDGLEIERLKKELEAMTEAERAISQAYVDLRVILGAMNPPSTEFSVLTKYVSDIAKKIVKAHDDN